MILTDCWRDEEAEGEEEKEGAEEDKDEDEEEEEEEEEEVGRNIEVVRVWTFPSAFGCFFKESRRRLIK